MNNKKKTTVLHISHTDVRTDSRILKEIETLASTEELDLVGVGIDALDRAPQSSKNKHLSLFALKIHRMRFIKLSGLRHLCVLMQFVFHVVKLGFELRPKVVHCHDTIALIPGLLLRLTVVPKLVYDAHELESDKNGSSWVTSKLTVLLERVSWPLVDLFVSVSPSIINWYQEKYGPKKNVLITNSPALSACKGGDANYLASHFGIPDQSLIFLYLGALTKGRGVETLVETFEKHVFGSHLVFMGYGDLDLYLKEKSEQCKRIHLHPAVPHDQVVSLASSADVGLCFIENVSLSDFYCLPNKLFEYAFCGLPVIASAFPDIKEYVERYSLGVVCDVTENDLIDKIRLMESRDVQFLDVDIQPLSWNEQGRKLCSAYQELLA